EGVPAFARPFNTQRRDLALRSQPGEPVGRLRAVYAALDETGEVGAPAPLLHQAAKRQHLARKVRLGLTLWRDGVEHRRGDPFAQIIDALEALPMVNHRLAGQPEVV